MDIPKYFCDHLNCAKLRVRSGEIHQFPIAYNREKGFFEWHDRVEMKVDFILEKGNVQGDEIKIYAPLFGNKLYIHFKSDQCNEIIDSIRLFCPLIFVPLIQKNRPFIIAHMAQTLDGKICTNTGKSKWIGNEENLKHAHRLRAMVDGVLVGGKTIANDLPRLNVRHVEGANPVRLLLSNTFCDFEKLPIVPNMKTFLLRRKENPIEPIGNIIDKVIYYEGNSDVEKLTNLLSNLKVHGIDSILVEGGPGTLSSFLTENKIDWLQLHIAPIIFGSGKSFIELSEISDVSEGRKLNNVFYNKMGDGIMMTGELN